MFYPVVTTNLVVCINWFIRSLYGLIKFVKTSILPLTCLFLSSTTFPVVVFANTNSQPVDSLVISEINPFGSIGPNGCKTNNSSANRCGFDKWIEIHNPGPNSINLNGWSLQFLESDQKINNLVFTSNILLPADSYFLIGYKENQYQSVLNLANINPGGITGKIRNLSNRETGRIQVNLLNPQGQKVFTVNLRLQDFPDLEDGLRLNKRYSLEYIGQQWVVANNEFYPNNFGTPKNTVNLPNPDLDNQKIESLVANTNTVNDPVPNHNTVENLVTENANATAIEAAVQPATQPSVQTQTNPETENLANIWLTTESEIASKTQTNPNLESATNVPEIASIRQQDLIVANNTQSAKNLSQSLFNSEWLTSSDLNNLLIKQINIFQPKTVILQEQTLVNSTQSTHSSSALFFTDQTSLWEYFFSYRTILLLALILFLGLALTQTKNEDFTSSTIFKWATV